MARPKTQPRDQARPFEIDELFFSTTDTKGVIKSGNAVFARVAAFDSVEALIGQPHNVIRHPDMPRAVFKLLWESIQAGKTFSGYVKNMAQDGCYYWVVALVTPIDGGYLSVRFKPSTPYLDVVKSLYAQLLEIEREAGSGPEERREGMQRAGEALGDALHQAGFLDYDHFMYATLAAEMASRRAQLEQQISGRRRYTVDPASRAAQPEMADTHRVCTEIDEQLDALFSEVNVFLELLEKLDAKSTFLQSLADDVHLVALNGVIASQRLGEAASGLAVVTEHLASVAVDSTATIADMTDSRSLTMPLRETGFAITAAKLQVEMALFFAEELLRARDGTANDDRSLARVRADLQTLVESFSQSTGRMLATLPHSKTALARRLGLHTGLRSMIRKLSMVHVTGKVQAAYIPNAVNVQEYFDSIHGQLQSAKNELDEISRAMPILVGHLPRFQKAGHLVHQTLKAFETAADPVEEAA